MKKALSVFLMTAMAFGAFAEEPVADVNVAEFSGWAKVEWGVDLDSGTTGFKNTSRVDLKLNLLNNGTKSTTGDGVWGELVLKVDGDEFIQWRHDNNIHGDGTFGPTEGMADTYDNGGGWGFFFKKIYVDKAQINFGPAYIGIKAGDTQTGKLKMDAAIRSADDDQATWLDNVGPKGYSQGIVAGYDSDMFKVDLDLRSEPMLKTDKNVEYQYTDNYAAALEGEFKGVENLSIKAGASYNFAKNYQANKANKDKTSINGPQHTLGYSASAGYKLGLNDTFFIRPQVGFTGTTGFTTKEVLGKEQKSSATYAEMAAGLLFGWGEIGQDKNAGVYYLDDDMAKKVTPGVGVVAHIPFATTTKTTNDGKTSTTTTYKKIAARIMPSFYSGELVPGLTAAAYGDIVVPKTGKDDNTTTYEGTENRATAMALAFGAQYAIPVGEMTITPKAGVRFANAAYVAYGITKTEKKDDAVFGEMGDQEELTGEAKANDKDGIKYNGNFMNLKLGVDVAGLIDNTTLSVVWATDNILNKLSDNAANINKLGTLNIGAKIAL